MVGVPVAAARKGVRIGISCLSSIGTRKNGSPCPNPLLILELMGQPRIVRKSLKASCDLGPLRKSRVPSQVEMSNR